MAIEKLSVILELITGNYKKEAREAATATGQVGDRAKSSSTELGLFGRNTDNVGKKLKGLATGALLAVGAAGVALIGKLDELGQKMESTERMADTVFGDMADSAREWADDNNEAFGIGESAMLSLIAKTQDLLVPMGFVREEAFDMSREILNTANALSEWEGGTIDAEDAQLRLAKAMLGETEGLVELGVKISQADIQMRLADKGMKGLTGSALQQAKAQVTLELVMERSTDALAAYEQRAGTATAAQKELAASTADTAESWAELLRGPIDTAKGALADVTDITQFLSEKMAENAGSAETLGEETDGVTQVWKVMQPVGALLLIMLDELAQATDDTGSAVQFMADANKDDLIPAVEAAADSIGGLIRSLDDERGALDHTRGAVDALRLAELRLADGRIANLSPALDALRAIQDSADAQDALTVAQEEGKVTQSELTQLQLEAAIAIEVAKIKVAEFAVTGSAGMAAFAAATGLGIDAARLLAFELEALTAKEWRVQIFADYKTNAASLAAAGAAAGNTDFLKDLNSKAFGGPISAGRPYLVGELGPELIIPGASGTVIPNSQLGGLSRSVSIVVQSPMKDFRTDLQYATILASVTNLVEGL